MLSTARWPSRWRKGGRISEAAAWANAAAALAVTQPGAQSALPFRDAIDQLAARTRYASLDRGPEHAYWLTSDWKGLLVMSASTRDVVVTCR